MSAEKDWTRLDYCRVSGRRRPTKETVPASVTEHTCQQNHTSHDSVCVVRTTFQVYGKRQTLTFSQPKTPEPIVTKSEWRDYVVDSYRQKSLSSIRSRVFAPI